MKRVVAAALLLLGSLFVMPLILVEGGGQNSPVLPPVPTAATTRGEDAQNMIRVKMGSGEVSEMTMADYLWSVTAAEMPASFEIEALKAQVVTARTYALRKMGTGEENHPDADVCTDINCCQAFLPVEAAGDLWGGEVQRYTDKIRSAVAQTDGEIVTYQGQAIQAVFFSSAAGQTEDAVAVWGNAVPYLVTVESPEGENVPDYHTEVVLSVDEFRDKILTAYPQADLSGPPSEWIQNKTDTSSGRVAELSVGGVTVKGTEMRSLLGLRSTCFSVEVSEDEVRFQVTGYGHGVGMSQYGANTLAQQGKTYTEILKWYYTGVEIRKQ